MADYSVDIQAKLSGFEKLDSLEKKIKALEKKNIKISVDVDNKNLDNILSRLSKNSEKCKIKPSVDTNGISESLKKTQSTINASKIQFKIDTGQTLSDLVKIESQMTKLKGSKFLNDSTFKDAYSTLKNFQNIKLDSGNIESYNKALKTCQNYLQAASSEMSTFVLSSQRLSLLERAQKTLRENSAYTKEAKAQIQDYIDEINKLGSSMSKLDHIRISDGLKSVDMQMRAIGKSGKSLPEEIGRGFKQIGQFAVTYGAIQRIPELISNMAKEVLNVDTAMTELRKVSDASDNQLGNYFEHATESARHYGSAISDVISSASDWKRLGYSLEESSKLADVTTLLQRVGDNMTQESSASGLISTLKGFGKDADEALSIVDKVNQVANTQPIDTAGLFAGLERSASSMSAANNTLEQTISLITAANSVVQDPDSIGTAYKTISMRIRGATTDLESAGLDTEGMAESTAKLREEIMALSGVDIMLDKNNFKSTYDILDELAMKWQSLSDIQQASVTELIAGKRQGNIVSALMQNFDIARETLDTAMNQSEGSAERELSNYQKSMQYSIDTFKAQFQELSTTALDSDFLKGAIDAGTGLLDVLTQIVDVGGTVPLILGAIGGAKLFKNLDLFYY